MSGESTPLLAGGDGAGAPSSYLNVETKAALPKTTAKARSTDDRNALAARGGTTFREKVYLVLEGLYKPFGIGRFYEALVIFLILASIASFVVGSLFVPEYNSDAPYFGWCGMTCDMWLFGNHDGNGLSFLGRGDTFNTSILEVATIAVFTIDYLLRLWTADIESPKYKGFCGRLRYIPTFYSLVDLISTVPFYFDALTPSVDVAATQFLRMFRFFRMLRVEGRYNLALDLFADVFSEQKNVLGTALFVGATTWITVASLFYVAERKNTDMIYCPDPGTFCDEGIDDMDDVDTDLCTIDSWGFVNCSLAGCPAYVDSSWASSSETEIGLWSELFAQFNPHHRPPSETCYNLYRSIPMSMYYSLLNLFGEFPLIDQHSTAGKIVGTLTAVVACAVFALPTGLIGNGMEDLLGRRRREAEREIEEQERETAEAAAASGEDGPFVANPSSFKGRMYNFLNCRVGSSLARKFDWCVNGLIFGMCLSVIVGTFAVKSDDSGGRDLGAIATGNLTLPIALNNFDFLVVCLFTAEYLLRWYASTAESFMCLSYLITYDGVVDLLPILPYWIWVGVSGQLLPGSSPAAYHAFGITFVRVLRLFRVLRFERYTQAFTTFDDVLRSSSDVLLITGFTALVVWVFFSAALYLTERSNPDAEMAEYYKTVPHAMWVTLLNLSGECPLDKYSGWGKVLTGSIGIFATGLFGIPIGILGAGFEELMEDKIEEREEAEEKEREEAEAAAASKTKEASDEENGGEGEEFADEAEAAELALVAANTNSGGCERSLYDFTEGRGSRLAGYFEALIYALIILTVLVGILQTVQGHENDLSELEWVAVVIFTVEYLLRFIGAGADPAFAHISNPVLKRMRFVVSFYSLIDLAAIVPFYLAFAMPGSWVDRHDEYLRMLRLLRLLKLDKYVPSISLIDDVFRLKKDMLIVTGYAAGTLWVLFTGLLYVFEYRDSGNDIDPVPVYGCDDDCTMMDRFRTYLDSMVYTCVHLTGDYPIISYSGAARVTCFFMVIAAVGVVSIPSGLVANGFAELVQTTSRKRHGEAIPTGGNAGDDWYEIRLRELEGTDPPPSRFCGPCGSLVDRWQIRTNNFLNGQVDPRTGKEVHTCGSHFFRFFMMTLIILNVIAVLLESIPDVDRGVGNLPGNFFDDFESFSIFFFSLEYALRLFSARKNLEALYSPFVYATTFYGIVDFLSTAPWYVERICLALGMKESADASTIFRIFRIFRLLQLEDFLVGFRKLDNVFRASKDVLKATGLMAVIIWVGCGALFFIFESGNPNWRSCDDSIPLRDTYVNGSLVPGCYDFASTRDCADYYGPDMCEQTSFVNMPDSLFYVAVFLGGEWGLIDFTWGGRFVCMFLCVIGIALYAIPVGSLFDSFGAVIGLGEDEDEEEDDEEEG